jgi:hypothetical protein
LPGKEILEKQLLPEVMSNTQEYSIAVLLPTRSRTDALTTSVTSIVDLADNISRIQLIFGFDDDDKIGLNHFETVIQPFLDKRRVSYEAQAFKSMGYAGLNRYYNHLAKSTSSDWLFVWNDDAVMETQGWDSIIEQYTGKFKLLKVHTHNDHPYSIFPIMPRAWYDLTNHLSRHQMIDAELSQIAFLLDIMQVIEVDVVHNQVELTKDATDPLKPKVRFEGNPANPIDFHHPQTSARRYQDCNIIADYMQTIGLDTSWWENVKSGKSYPWEKLIALDVNKQMSQFVMELDERGQVLSYSKDQKSEDIRGSLATK